MRGWPARDFVTPEGLDLSLPNAVSVVAALVALVAWASGCCTRCRRSAPSCCRSPRSASLLPVLVTNPHRFSYADEPWAALHIAVALVSYALFLVAAVQALMLMGLEKRLHRRLPDPGASGHAAAADARARFCSGSSPWVRAADADARQRHAVFRADLRQADPVHAPERVLGAGWAHVRRAPAGAAGATGGAAASRCAGSSPARCSCSSPTSARSSCSRCCSAGASGAADSAIGIERTHDVRAGARHRLTADARMDDIPLSTLAIAVVLLVARGSSRSPRRR